MIGWIYDRFGNQIDCIGDFIDFAHDDEIGALDYIEFTIPGARLDKGQYIVWRDEFQAWHEHRIESVDQRHIGGSVYQHVYADNSITDLMTYYIDDRNAYNCSNYIALRTLFDGIELWELGTVQGVGGDNDHKFYHCTAYEGLTDVIGTWGGEIDTTINVDAFGVSRRRLNYYAQRGKDNGLLFTYGYDADNIVRTVDIDEVYTRLHCFGKGEETLDETGQGTGNYSRRITFADINDGKDYVDNDEALERWGMPDGKGGKRHSEGWFIWEEVTDKEELLELGKSKVKELSKPRASYTANVIVLADAGMDFKNVRSGDTVYIRDEPLDERLNGRVLHVRRYLAGDKPTEVTLGNVIRTLSNVIKDQQSVLDSLNRRASSWDEAGRANGQWLENLINNLNQEMNTGGGYAYWEPGEGITVYDRKLEDDPTMAIQLKGAGFRIANGKTSTGEWNWRTFGTGDGFTADLLNVGTIRGGQSFWNLLSGDLETHYMKAYNMTATGSFECGTDTQKMRMADGRITGLRNGSQIGYLDFTGQYVFGSGQRGYGLSMRSSDMIETRTENLMFGKYNSMVNGAYSWGGITKDIVLDYVTSVSGSGTGVYANTATAGFKFVNGGLIAWM